MFLNYFKRNIACEFLSLPPYQKPPSFKKKNSQHLDTFSFTNQLSFYQGQTSFSTQVLKEQTVLWKR